MFRNCLEAMNDLCFLVTAQLWRISPKKGVRTQSSCFAFAHPFLGIICLAE